MLKSLKVANYKNIGDSFIGFDRIEKFNILIGRNNIGKSTLLEFINTFNHIYNNRLMDKYLVMDLEISVKIDSVPNNIFGEGTYDYDIGDYAKYGQSLLDKTIVYQFKKPDGNCYVKQINQQLYNPYGEYILKASADKLLKKLGNEILKSFINEHKIIKLDADRNLLPEVESTSLNIETDGSGATNLVRTYLHNSERDFKVVEEKILNALNKIVSPDE